VSARWVIRLLLVLYVAVLSSAGAAPAPASAASAGPAVARWVAPLPGPVDVRRGFSPPRTRWGPGHRGVDLAAGAGAVVRAAGAGVVTYAGVLAGRGVVVVRHGALRTTYEPLTALARVGTVVAPGTPIGRLAFGHGGPEPPGVALLHWGLLRGQTYLDPMRLLRFAPSRLVPVASASPAASSAAFPVRADGLVAAPALDTRSVPASPARSGRGDDGPRGVAPATVALGGGLVLAAAVSRAGRRACRAAGARPSCASGRSGSRSRPGPGRSPPA
jgi:Peptidase family M23